MSMTKINKNSQSNDWQRLSEWIHCICVVTFDLELGQAMEAIYPSHVELSEKEKLNICYLAFPDSNSGCMGDTKFHIRLRVASGTKYSLLNSELQRFSLQCVTVQRPDLGHYWGFVYFRQTKDSSLPRGYFQKSVILLSRLPFINLFYEMCSLIAPKYFESGESVLENACMDISNWPSLQAGECIQLQLLGTLYQTYIPSLTSANLQQPLHLPTSSQSVALDERLPTTTKTTAFHSPSIAKKPTQDLYKVGNDHKCIVKSKTIDLPSTSSIPQSRENILDNYKQSKEVLLAQTIVSTSLSHSIKSATDINSANNDYDNKTETNGVDNDADFNYVEPYCKIDNSSSSDIKINEIANTQCSRDSSSSRLISISATSKCSQQTIPRTPIVLSSLHEIDIFRSLYMVLSYTHLLWELVLTAEPIVVMATSPSDCSHMVQSLMSLIAPLSYSAEARPYFTIHDSEFKEFTQRQQGPLPIILGVTNPFFAKTLQHWPHLIRLADNHSVFNFHTNPSNNSSTSSMPSQQGLRKLKIFTKILDTPPGVYTQYKPFLHKDKSIIRNLMNGVKKQRPAEVQSAILRRHLLELTQSFMIPLERYMASLMPLQKDISAFRAAPAPNNFKPDRFLATLEQSGPQLTSPLKGDWSGLYKRFFRSPNFRDWYELRYRELNQTLHHLQIQILSNTNLTQWMEGKHEVEIVDMILKVKQKLKICNELSMDGLPQVIIAQNENTRKQLLSHLEDMKRLLPDDLNKILNSS